MYFVDCSQTDKLGDQCFPIEIALKCNAYIDTSFSSFKYSNRIKYAKKPIKFK